MTTIDHQQAARSTHISPALPGMIRDLWKSDPSERSVQTALALAGDLIQELIDLRAATPHLRAAWEQPIRELCEGALAKASDPLAGRMFDGSPFPAVVRAKDVLALLEGGAE